MPSPFNAGKYVGASGPLAANNPFSDAPQGAQYGTNSTLGLEDLSNPALSLTDQYYLAGVGANQFAGDPKAQQNFQNWQTAMQQYQQPGGGWMPEATQARQVGQWSMPDFA